MLPRAPITARAEFGPYLLLEQIGQGGMAQVWKARREGPAGFAKNVVLKVILPRLAVSPQFLQMFASEAKISARLSHPNIVQVHDFGFVDNVPFLVMEHIEGKTINQLGQRLRDAKRALPVGAAVAIVAELAQGLGYAHEFVDEFDMHHSIVHGDVSPSNVMLSDSGSVKLIDFGVARMGARFTRFGHEGLIGKCSYLAPEQVMGLSIDGRADVFSAGILLHELLTGRRLFQGHNDPDTLALVRDARVVPPSHFNSQVPPELDAIVLQALARDPEARFASGRELAIALERLEGPCQAFSRSQLSALARSVSVSGSAPLDTGFRTRPVSRPKPSVASIEPTAQHVSATVNERPEGLRSPSRSRSPRRWLRARPTAALAALCSILILPCEAGVAARPQEPRATAAAPIHVAPLPDGPAPGEAAPELAIPVGPPPAEAPRPVTVRPASPAVSSARPKRSRTKRRAKTRVRGGLIIDPFR